LIDPSIALENDNVKESLKNNDTERLIKILESEF
jgi:hypothetical protein